ARAASRVARGRTPSTTAIFERRAAYEGLEHLGFRHGLDERRLARAELDRDLVSRCRVEARDGCIRAHHADPHRRATVAHVDGHAVRAARRRRPTAATERA